MSFRQIARVTLPVIVLGAAGFAMMAFFPGRGKEHEAGQVTFGSIAGVIEESGDIASDEEYTYFSNVNAPIAYVAVEKGDEIHRGQKLVEYDTEDYERMADQASISRSQSENNSQGQISRSNAYQSKYNQAVADDTTYAVLYWWEREASDYLSEEQYQENWDNQNRINELNTCIAQKNEEITQKNTKLLDGGLSDEEREELNKDISGLREDIAQAQAEIAGMPQMQMNPNENMMQDDVANLMEDISRNWSETKTRKAKYEEGIINSSQKAALMDQVELARANENNAITDLRKAQAGITADFNGIVTECHIRQGSVVSRGTPLFTVVSRDAMKVSVMISKYDIAGIRTGQRAEIDVAGQLYVGYVSKINQIAQTDSSDKSKVEVDVKIEGGRGLILGLEADVRIFTDEKKNVLLIPYQAFYSDDDGEYVYIINSDSLIEKKYFTAGIVNNDYVEVIDGLSRGMTVITDAVTDEQIGDKAFEAVH